MCNTLFVKCLLLYTVFVLYNVFLVVVCGFLNLSYVFFVVYVLLFVVISMLSIYILQSLVYVVVDYGMFTLTCVCFTSVYFWLLHSVGVMLFCPWLVQRAICILPCSCLCSPTTLLVHHVSITNRLWIWSIPYVYYLALYIDQFLCRRVNIPNRHSLRSDVGRHYCFLFRCM